MASSEPPPPSKMKSAPAAPTTIRGLGDDLLREVFLRLPSLPSLVRAALTCPAFLRAVRSSPAFRRRFLERHPAPLLGIFLDIYKPAMPAFVPVRRRSDPDHAAAIHGADVFLARLPDDEDAGEDDGPGWSMTSCRDGYVVLVNRSTKRAAVYDPLTRGLHLLRAPPVEICEEDAGKTKFEYHVVAPDKDRRSFRVLCISRKMDEEWWGHQVQVAVFSPASREWEIFPKAGSLQNWAIGNGKLVDGSVYWTSGRGSGQFHVLNTGTLQFSEIDLPPERNVWGSALPPEPNVWGSPERNVWGSALPPEPNVWRLPEPNVWGSSEPNVWGSSEPNVWGSSEPNVWGSHGGWGSALPAFKVGETSGGKPCLAREAELTLEVWVWRAAAADDNVDRWMPHTTFPMPDAIGKLELQTADEGWRSPIQVVTIISGTVYLSFNQRSFGTKDTTWLLSFCIETEELKKVCPITCSIDESYYPYVMAWPPVLVGCKVNSELQGV
uniref:F-box domain-containing protein n=2 Tax=Hordeum vulgare subsp. vulgare TaxID=112509 RepID=A0A8I6XTW6_HORVV